MYDSPYMWIVNSNDSNEHTYKTGTGSQTSRTSLWLLRVSDKEKAEMYILGSSVPKSIPQTLSITMSKKEKNKVHI